MSERISVLDFREGMVHERLRGVKKVILVVSGKGGVGKSVVSATLAGILARTKLRVYFRHLRYLNSDFLFEMDDFVVNCHARIEDEVVFPEMRKAAGAESTNIESITKRMEDEHRVLQMLGNNIRLAVAEGSKEIDRSKVTLYADILESHNSSEETLLFPDWKVDIELGRQSVSKARQIIHDFGLSRYLKVTGFSQEFLSLLQ